MQTVPFGLDTLGISWLKLQSQSKHLLHRVDVELRARTQSRVVPLGVARSACDVVCRLECPCVRSAVAALAGCERSAFGSEAVEAVGVLRSVLGVVDDRARVSCRVVVVLLVHAEVDAKSLHVRAACLAVLAELAVRAAVVADSLSHGPLVRVSVVDAAACDVGCVLQSERDRR